MLFKVSVHIIFMKLRTTLVFMILFDLFHGLEEESDVEDVYSRITW